MREHTDHKHKSHDSKASPEGQAEWHYPSENRSISSKILIIIILALVAFIAYLKWDYILALLQQNAFIWSAYSYVAQQLGERTLQGLFLAAAFGSVLFMPLPSEIVFLLYLQDSVYHPAVLIAVIIAGNISGLLLNYMVAFVLGKRIMEFFLGSAFSKVHGWSERFGGAIVLVSSLFSSSSQIASAVMGAARYSMRKFIMYCIIGQAIEYTALFFARGYIISTVLPYIGSLL